MTPRPTTVRLIAFPLRAVAMRAGVFLLFLTAASLLIASKKEHATVEHLRSALTELLVPVMSVLSSPLETFHSAKDTVQSWVFLHQENVALKVENARLKRWMELATHMEIENQALRSLAQFAPSTVAQHFVSARVVGHTGASGRHSVFINAGADSGVVKNSAVINKDGLIGKVVAVGAHSSRVLLLTDITMRVPVITETSRERSMLAGDGSAEPGLLYTLSDSNIAVGERVLTTGDGHTFPAGTPVGTVASIDDGQLRVTPFVSTSRLDYVSVMLLNTTP